MMHEPTFRIIQANIEAAYPDEAAQFTDFVEATPGDIAHQILRLGFAAEGEEHTEELCSPVNAFVLGFELALRVAAVAASSPLKPDGDAVRAQFEWAIGDLESNRRSGAETRELEARNKERELANV